MSTERETLESVRLPRRGGAGVRPWLSLRLLVIPWRNLRRRPARSALTTVGIAAAVGSYLAMVGTVGGLERAWTGWLQAQGTHVFAVRKGTVELLAATLDQSLGAELRGVAGVTSATGELVELAELANGEMLLLIGLAPDDGFWRSARLLKGRLPHDDERGVVVLGETVAEALVSGPGDELALADRSLNVVGIIASSGGLTGWGAALPLAALQELVGKPGQVTSFSIRVERPDEPAAVSATTRRLASAQPGLVFTEVAELGEKNQVIRILRAVAWSVSVIGVAMAFVVVLNTMLMSVMERTREIGTLRAVGWRSEAILGVIVLEGLVLTAAGAAAGTAFGLLGLRWLATASPMRGVLDAQVPPALLLEVAVATVLLGIVGSIYPAWRAVRLDPVQALRSE